MHTFFFTLRRADLCSLRFQRELLKELGITPARYLMLFVIATRGLPFGETSRFMIQSDIARALGVSRMTVSVMLRALEENGFVTRTRQEWRDRRQIIVRLTPRAVTLLKDVHRALIRTGVVWCAVYSIDPTGRKVGGTKYWLDDFRKKFEDTATFRYPWCDRTLYRERFRSRSAS